MEMRKLPAHQMMPWLGWRKKCLQQSRYFHRRKWTGVTFKNCSPLFQGPCTHITDPPRCQWTPHNTDLLCKRTLKHTERYQSLEPTLKYSCSFCSFFLVLCWLLLFRWFRSKRFSSSSLHSLDPSRSPIPLSITKSPFPYLLLLLFQPM